MLDGLAKTYFVFKGAYYITLYLFFFFYMFLANQRFIFVIFSSVAAHRGQPAAKCHPRWQPTRRSAVSCGLGRRWILTRDCRTTVWHATIEPPRLPLYLYPVRGIIQVSWLSCHGLYALSPPYGSCQSGMETTNMM